MRAQGMLLADLLPLLDRLAPLALAETWDNTGLLLGHPQDVIERVWLTIDLTSDVLIEARAAGAQLIVAYHPTWFGAKKRLVGDEVLLTAARLGVAIYSPHTALDAALGGTNDVLADAAGVEAQTRAPLAPAKSAQAPPGTGMGRVGPLAQGADFSVWLGRLTSAMGVAGALVARPRGASEVLAEGSRIAVCAGAGDGLLDAAHAARAVVYVVGELRHHAAQRAMCAGVTVVALTHSGSERAALAPYAAALRLLAPALTFGVSAIDADPYTFA